MKMTPKPFALASLFLFILLSFSFPAAGKEDKGAVLSKVRSLQVPFIENSGQIEDHRVKYYAKTFGGTVFITEDGKIIYSLPVSTCRGGSVTRPQGRFETCPYNSEDGIEPAGASRPRGDAAPKGVATVFCVKLFYGC